MARDERINIVVAETSPIVSAGLNACLRRLPGLSAIPYEVRTFEHLIDTIRERNPKIVIANPYFGGVFDPARLRASLPEMEFKLVAIDTGGMNPHSRQLYDATISVMAELSEIAECLAPLISGMEKDEAAEEKDSISQREKEIIALVAKGMTNKEIADKLYLSVHTVITHRRNIARKLEIHSATGLTIYAIVNHLVDLKDIKM